jgi:hypothetical protein
MALPTEEDYRPPSPPAQRELGPPPPGYSRYTEFGGSGRGETPNGGGAGGMGRGTNGSGGVGAGQFGDAAPRRNLDEVLCFKVMPWVSPLISWSLTHFDFTSLAWIVWPVRTLCEYM